ncbi:MAG: hypothetical protein OEV31_03350, partial [Gammaproteobacteria bacterium]|nr:hypothetical protein [Gammaproteobacteria bacterium]
MTGEVLPRPGTVELPPVSPIRSLTTSFQHAPATWAPTETSAIRTGPALFYALHSSSEALDGHPIGQFI